VIKIISIIGAFLLDFIETIVTSLVIFIFVYLFLFQPHQVKGVSMYPNFENGENLLTNKIVYRFSKPQRGDVIIFKAPPKQNYDYIKRVIGLPGERLSLKNNKFFINDAPLNESFYLADNIPIRDGHFLHEGEEITIPENQYFVAGDNRSHSSDSREWGCIPLENIIGRAWLRYWPPDKFGLIPRMAR